MKELDPVAKWLFALIGLVFVGLGVAAITTGYVPPRPTRWGMTAALNDRQAITFGVAVMALGLATLSLLLPTQRAVVICGGLCIAVTFVALVSPIFGI